ncbi:MAG TPA: HlyD family secretion protein [Terriglobales bacterium]|jgi:membrane fusion protein (multidrug efflux system)|nr:HlyD family secretion protein [Terriglobales bacterium]
MSEIVEEPTRDARDRIFSAYPDGDGSTRDFEPARHASAASRRRWIKIAVIAAAGLIVAAVAVHYYLYAVTHESTDDAFIEGDIVSMSPKLASYVTGLHIDDNRLVKKGDLLVELDARDFAARLARARADLAAAVAKHRSAEINVKVVDTTSGAGVDQTKAGVEAARLQVEEARSRLEQARAQVAAAQAEATRADEDAQRYERLLKYHAVSRQERDNAVAAYRTASANLDGARQAQQAVSESSHRAESQLGEAKARLASAKVAPNRVAFSRAQVATSAAEIAQAEAEVQQAELDLSYTKIYAPQNGKITRKNVELGDYVQVGQTLFSIVPDRLWVIANFKETQLRHMRPGQPVTIEVDAYPDKEFHGHVDSIQAGSGARFSLLPPENATGNYVKVVQRVPVKIVFDDPPDPSYPLGPGMSVEPVVKVR